MLRKETIIFYSINIKAKPNSFFKMAVVTENEVDIGELSHHNVEGACAFTEIDVDIKIKSHKAGKIKAVLIDRSKIPYGYFLSEMDDYSADT